MFSCLIVLAVEILMEVLFESEGVKRMKSQRVDRSSIENSLRKALAS